MGIIVILFLMGVGRSHLVGVKGLGYYYFFFSVIYEGNVVNLRLILIYLWLVRAGRTHCKGAVAGARAICGVKSSDVCYRQSFASSKRGAGFLEHEVVFSYVSEEGCRAPCADAHYFTICESCGGEC